MSPVIVTALAGLAITAGLVYTAYWAGAAAEHRRTRVWARRAVTLQSHCNLLEGALLEAHADLISAAEQHRPLSPVEAAAFAKIEQGLFGRPDASDESA